MNDILWFRTHVTFRKTNIGMPVYITKKGYATMNQRKGYTLVGVCIGMRGKGKVGVIVAGSGIAIHS